MTADFPPHWNHIILVAKIIWLPMLIGIGLIYVGRIINRKDKNMNDDEKTDAATEETA